MVKKDQFRILPTPDPTLDRQVLEAEDVEDDNDDDDNDDDIALLPPLPEMMPIDGRPHVDVPVLPTQVDQQQG